MSRRYRDADFLREQYVEKDRSATEIAEMCGTSSSTISRWLDRHDISRKQKYQQKSWLETQYVSLGRDQQEIADECGVAKTTICHWLARHDITEGDSLEKASCRTCGGSFRYYPAVRDGEFCSNECAKQQQKERVEVTCPGCEQTFTRWESLDTQYCSMECWGEDHRVFSENPYRGRWHSQRQKALERDRYRCTVCGITAEKHKRRFGKSLDVHHIVPIRLFAKWGLPVQDAHALRNLRTLCRTHHPDASGTTVEG